VADIFGALAQTMPAATTLTASYTCPAGKRATVQVTACNRGATGTIRLSHAINGAADTGAQYLLYDAALAAATSTTTQRFTVTAGDVIRVYASHNAVAFNINGIEEPS